MRQQILDFIFFAIEAGASSIILPSIALRVEDHLADLTGGGRANFTYMFDEDFFRSHMRAACPQIRIYSPTDIALEQAIRVPYRYQPTVPNRREVDKDTWVAATLSWLRHRTAIDSSVSTIVALEATLWEINTRSHLPDGFRRNFGQALRVHPDIRQFAAVAMSELTSDRYNISLDPTDHIHPRAFYGAHLRTESDAAASGYLSTDPGINPEDTEYPANWTVQTDVYLKQAMTYGLSTIFAASGDAYELERFRTKGAEHDPPISIVTKWDLLSAEDSKALKELHWDQQALVDLEVLKKCSVFGGYAKSSFAWYIAVARTELMAEKRASGVTTAMDAWNAPKWGDGRVTFDNGMNMLFGRCATIEHRVFAGVWP